MSPPSASTPYAVEPPIAAWDTRTVLPITADGIRLFLHVLAATVWVGGQVTLGALVPVLRGAGADVPRLAARAFGRIAWVAFGVLVATGIWNVAAAGDTNANGYQVTLGLKLGVVALSGLAAYTHQRAKSRVVLAVGGAAAALFSVLAVFLGVVLVAH
jgi:putative copper export protein